MLHAEEIRIAQSTYIQPLDSATEKALSKSKSEELNRHQEIMAEIQTPKKFSYLESAKLEDGKIHFTYNNGTEEKEVVKISVASLVADDTACSVAAQDCCRVHEDRVCAVAEAPRAQETSNTTTFVGCYETLDELEVGIRHPNKGMIVVVSGQMYIYDGNIWLSLGRLSATVNTSNHNVDYVALNITEKRGTTYKVKDTYFDALSIRKKRNLHKV